MLGFNAQNMHIYLVRLLGRPIHRFELLILGSVMYNLQCVSYIINWTLVNLLFMLYQDWYCVARSLVCFANFEVQSLD